MSISRLVGVTKLLLKETGTIKLRQRGSNGKRTNLIWEVLFIALVVLSITTLITTSYLQTNETTTILSVTKSEILTELNKSNSNNLIQSINIEKTPTTNTKNNSANFINKP